MKNKQLFHQKYGPRALVAGASEGLGAAFCEELAKQHFDLVLVARREEPLKELASRLSAEFGIEITTIIGDLADPETLKNILQVMQSLDVGLLVYNAAFSAIGEFASLPIAQLNQSIDVNIRGPVTLVHGLVSTMRKRTGGIVLMSSIAGNQGAPNVAVYGASKAYNTILGQSLARELKPRGIDVTVCCAGAIRTPGYQLANARQGKTGEAPGTLSAKAVARTALNALGRKPFVIPGCINRIAVFVLGRLLPRRMATWLMAKATKKLETTHR